MTANPYPIAKFRCGKIVSTPNALSRLTQEDILVAIGAVSERELNRQVCRQIETVVFELLSWSEGFFSFEEGDRDGELVDPEAGLTTESLLMEAASKGGT